MIFTTWVNPMKSDLSKVLRLFVLISQNFLESGLDVASFLEPEERRLREDDVLPSRFRRTTRNRVVVFGPNLDLVLDGFDLHLLFFINYFFKDYHG